MTDETLTTEDVVLHVGDASGDIWVKVSLEATRGAVTVLKMSICDEDGGPIDREDLLMRTLADAVDVAEHQGLDALDASTHANVMALKQRTIATISQTAWYFIDEDFCRAFEEDDSVL